MEPKIIIFDLDGTLYNIEDILPNIYRLETEYLSKQMKISLKESQRRLDRHKIYPFKRADANSATEYFAKIGLDINQWREYKMKYFDVNSINTKTAASQALLDHFASICPLILLSTNYYKNIIDILERINISIKLFSEIICQDKKYFETNTIKKEAYKYISEKYNVSFKDMFTIGDRYLVDIKPLIELGGNGVLIESPQILKQVLEGLKNRNFTSDVGCNWYIS